MLIAMISVWAREGEPIYPSMEDGQTIAYVYPLSRMIIPFISS